jgi:subtilase family serine protease
VLEDGAYTVGSPSSATVTIASDDLPPDLVVSAITAPASAAVGSTVAIVETTRNQGTEAAPASETGFYLSTNSTIEPSDVFLGSRMVSALVPGGSEQATSSLVIPESTIPGSYHIIAAADWSGQVEETNNTNNTRTSATVRVGPDLLVSSVSVPSTAAAGAVVNVADTTKNQGAGEAPPTVTAFYLSSNSTWDASDAYLGQRAVPALSGGGTDSASTAVTIPGSTAAGSYYILARADTNDAVIEWAETNNVRSATVRVGADLVVTALTGPSVATSGTAMNVTETTANTGGAETPLSTTEYYLSANTGLDGADVPLGSRQVPALAAGASSQATVSLMVPAGTAAGSYYVLAQADGPGEIAETSETNNVRASGAVKVGPDLIVLTLVAPSTAAAGSTLSVTETVKNQGGAPSAATVSAFLLSSNTTLDGGDVELGTRTVPALNASASSVATVLLVLPASLATGSYYILSQVDPTNVVPESLESNNVKVSGVVRVGPDLVVSSLTGPSSAVRGANVVVTDTTRNQGGDDAGASVTRFYLSSNSGLDAGDLLLGSRTVDALGAGASSMASTSLAIPAGTATGLYYVIARTDDLNDVAETLETNNTRALSLRINP